MTIKLYISLSWVTLVLLGLASFVGQFGPRASAASCAELIVNGGFETDTIPWQATSAGGYSLISELGAHTGVWGAYLGGYNSADDQLSQEITLPSAATITLRFWWQMTTEETSHPWDSLDVNIIPANGTPTRLLRITDGDIAGTWQESVLDLTSFAGQNVTLAFHAQTDQNRPTDFFLDDVSVEDCSADVTPSPTDTATPTPTSTPSTSPTATVSPGAMRVYLPVIVR